MTTSLDAAPAASLAPTPRLATLRESWARIVRPPRVAGIDLARAAAIVGMIAAHVGGAPPLVLTEPSTWAGVVHGRSSLLFALVAGVSLALMSRNVRAAPVTEVRRVRLTLVGRGLVILALGVLLELVGSPIAIILGFYGVLFIVVAPVIAWPTRRLLLTVAALVVVAVPSVTLAMLVGVTGGPTAQLVLFGMYSMPVWLTFALTGLAVGRGDLRSARRAGTLIVAGLVLCAAGYGGAALLTPGAPDDMPSKEPPSSSSMYTEVPGEDVDLAGFTCIRMDGAAVSCWPGEGDASGGFGTGSASSGSDSSGSGAPGASASGPGASGVAASGSGSSVSGPIDASFGWSGSGASRWWRSPATFDGVTGATVVMALFSMEAHSGGLGEVIGSGGFTLVILGLCLLAGRPRALRLVLVPIAALGSMPLTVYSLHVVSFFVPALTEPATLTRWLAQIAGLTVLATVWALTVGRGPLEQLTASLAARYAARDQPPRGA